MKEVLVIGGTGAQGLPVKKALSQSGDYSARVLTRNLGSRRAQDLSQLPHVTLVQGSQDNQKDLHKAFKGVWGAWVNTDGFTLGEKNELFYGIRAYEIARHEGVQHYIYAGTNYAVKDADWDENYHWGHNDAKGRVADLILSHKQGGMKRGKIPLIAVEDVGAYSLWMFENPSESTGVQLKIATDAVTFEEIAEIFTKVTGKKALHEYVPLEQYLPAAEPYPNAPANWAAGPDAPRDDSTMTWRENFGPWWRYWGEGVCENRDFALLDRIHPKRIKSLKGWMRLVGYDGQPKPVLKGVEDLRAAQQAKEKV
ncbi:hypothetical protein LTR86_009685 [Recurvomyces mirabilis]|nr:hypothetical protein LTR86_009685 [Recurvomyces mirabilis]